MTMPTISSDRTTSACGLCRQCNALLESRVVHCPDCRSPNNVFHPELHQLHIAHIDCDAFFASIEKRDHPQLRGRPVIIGGGARGVVSTACYLARIHGVHAAMPMFKAKRACPDAVVRRPDMRKYAAVARQLRLLLGKLTPQVQPTSIDEAYIDLQGTMRLHKKTPAQCLAHLARSVEKTLGITISIGLSYNKFLAKLASDMDKPRGFYVIGKRETLAFLAGLPVGKIPGIGSATQNRLARLGLTHLGQIQALSPEDAQRYFGQASTYWRALAHGLDDRPIRASSSPAKSISIETTFTKDVQSQKILTQHLWQLTDTLSQRCLKKQLAGSTVQLKLRQANFRRYSRTQKLAHATRLPKPVFQTAQNLLSKTLKQFPDSRWRLLGIGLSNLVPAEKSDVLDLSNPDARKEHQLQHAIDKLRAKFGVDSIQLGYTLPASSQIHHR